VDGHHASNEVQSINSISAAIQAEFMRKVSDPMQLHKIQERKAHADRHSLKKIDKIFQTNEVVDGKQAKNSGEAMLEDFVYTEVEADYTDMEVVHSAPPSAEDSNVTERNIQSGSSMVMANQHGLKTVPSTSSDFRAATAGLHEIALVRFCGSAQMKAFELRDMDVSRALSTLCFSPNRERFFALLRVRSSCFTVSKCDLGVDNTNSYGDDGKTAKYQRQKVMKVTKEDTNFCRAFDRSNDESQMRVNNTGLLSCIRKSNDSSSYHRLHHNDSIKLKAYAGLKKTKQIFEYLYSGVIFCGSQMAGVPENMLFWIYHTSDRDWATAECCAAECDDQQHAAHLSRLICQNILKSRR